MADTIAIVSGGLDSVVLAHRLDAMGYGPLRLLTFDYGQRHGAREIGCAAKCAQRLGAEHTVYYLPLPFHSALTDRDIEVPDGHYTDASMAATVVPNRNAIMLAVAFGFAVSERADMVAIGVHAGDHPIYPDCRPEFLHAIQAMQEGKRRAKHQAGSPGCRPEGDR